MMNIEQVRQFRQDLKRTLQDSGVYDLKRKLKSMSLTEQFPGLAETITKAAEAQESLAYHQPPKPYFPEPIALGYSANIMRHFHNDEKENKLNES